MVLVVNLKASLNTVYNNIVKNSYKFLRIFKLCTNFCSEKSFFYIEVSDKFLMKIFINII